MIHWNNFESLSQNYGRTRLFSAGLLLTTPLLLIPRPRFPEFRHRLDRIQRGSSPRLEGRGSSSPSIDLDFRGSLSEGLGLIIRKILYFLLYFTVIFYDELHCFMCGLFLYRVSQKMVPIAFKIHNFSWNELKIWI